MEISGKSWVWANTYHGRKSIRAVKIRGQVLQVNHRVTDMGCDVSCGCAKVKTKSKVRLRKALRVLNRNKNTIPKAFKSMTKSLGHGIVAYGSALVDRTDAEWKSSSMIQCLGRARSGSSPWFAACICGKVTDPQLSDPMCKVKFWRTYFRHHPYDVAACCRKLHVTHIPEKLDLLPFSNVLSQKWDEHGARMAMLYTIED